MPKVMPPKIMNFCPQQSIAPSLGIDLDSQVASIRENVGLVIALPSLQYI